MELVVNIELWWGAPKQISTPAEIGKGRRTEKMSTSSSSPYTNKKKSLQAQTNIDNIDQHPWPKLFSSTSSGQDPQPEAENIWRHSPNSW